jgi:nucleoside-diphosphate-sugar epimerase
LIVSTRKEIAMPSILILGPNGHVGQYVTRAFADAGWRVTAFGRANRQPIAGVRFIAGDAANPAMLAAAMEDADIVFNGLNLPYDKWFGGRAEAQHAAVIAAMGKVGRLMLFPGNIYNYAASDRAITPDTPQRPETERGAIRVRIEKMIAEAAAAGDIRAVILRAGDFFSPSPAMSWFSALVLRELGKGRITLPLHGHRHAYAYVPDLAEAFVRLAERRDAFGAFETFHFGGHFVNADEIQDSVERAAGRGLKRSDIPWTLLAGIGLFQPVIREMVKMRYLWDNPMALVDPRLDTLLGLDFGTPLDTALAQVVAAMHETKVA